MCGRQDRSKLRPEKNAGKLITVSRRRILQWLLTLLQLLLALSSNRQKHPAPTSVDRVTPNMRYIGCSI